MTRLKYEHHLVERPLFHVLLRNILRRVSALLYFHHGQRLDLDFRGLLERAQAVELAEDHTRWEDWERYSTRQGSRMKLGGIVGSATYRGELEEFVPYLVAGSYLHVGKGATFGLGRYRLVG
ncbi:MAG: CRISPR system precrRNA processing endoribonuclease RAMP protein Cas6 [Acetobacteraceae bacterium]|nr:CRISPR system precrRNA processing endoribonuclease RAMP protein Cas6 [Acetobacteraceae bacterium]